MNVIEFIEHLSNFPSDAIVTVAGGSNLETYLPETKDIQFYENKCLIDLGSCETVERGDEDLYLDGNE